MLINIDKEIKIFVYHIKNDLHKVFILSGLNKKELKEFDKQFPNNKMTIDPKLKTGYYSVNCVINQEIFLYETLTEIDFYDWILIK